MLSSCCPVCKLAIPYMPGNTGRKIETNEPFTDMLTRNHLVWGELPVGNISKDLLQNFSCTTIGIEQEETASLVYCDHVRFQSEREGEEQTVSIRGTER